VWACADSFAYWTAAPAALARLVGVSSVPKRQRKIAERTDVDVLGKLEGKPAMLAGSYNAVRARGAATQPGSPGAFNRGPRDRGKGGRMDGDRARGPNDDPVPAPDERRRLRRMATGPSRRWASIRPDESTPAEGGGA